MEEKDRQYGAFRLKYSTLSELQRLKITTESSLGRKITNDDFILLLISKAMGTVNR